MVPVAVVVGGVAVVETAGPCRAESWLAVVRPLNAWPEGSSSTSDVIAARAAEEGLVTMRPDPGGDERETAGEELFALGQVARRVAAALELPQCRL